MEHCVADRLVWRQVCRGYLEAGPDDTTLIRRAPLLEPPTRAALDDRGVELARALKVTRGRKLRANRPGVAPPIPHPTASRLLSDGGRVLGRLLRRARRLAQDVARCRPPVDRGIP